MLPYSGLPFFLAFFAAALFLYFKRQWLSRVIPYRLLLAVVTILYLQLIFPNPTHLLAFVVFEYLVYLLARARGAYRLAVVFSLAPMVFAKFQLGPSLFQTLGLSFMTFRAVGVLFETRDEEALTLLDYALFVAFPPTILAGPVDRWESFRPTLDEGYAGLKTEFFSGGLSTILLGVVQKFVLAEFVSKYLMPLASTNSTALRHMAFHAYCYAAFLYFDFAGYSNMAVGACLILGFHAPKNFDRPYLALNPPDFWKRFHISLGDWLRQYVFSPVYKSLRTRPRFEKSRLLPQNVAIFMTLFLMGVWNGVELHNILTGIYFGLLSVAYTSYVFYARGPLRGFDAKVKNVLSNGPVGLLLKRAVALSAATVGLYLFSGHVPQIFNFEVEHALKKAVLEPGPGGSPGSLVLKAATKPNEIVPIEAVQWIPDLASEALSADSLVFLKADGSRQRAGFEVPTSQFDNTKEELGIFAARKLYPLSFLDRVEKWEGFLWNNRFYLRTSSDVFLGPGDVYQGGPIGPDGGIKINIAGENAQQLAVFIRNSRLNDYRPVDLKRFYNNILRGELVLSTEVTKPLIDDGKPIEAVDVRVLLGRSVALSMRTNFGGYFRVYEMRILPTSNVNYAKR